MRMLQSRFIRAAQDLSPTDLSLKGAFGLLFFFTALTSPYFKRGTTVCQDEIRQKNLRFRPGFRIIILMHSSFRCQHCGASGSYAQFTFAAQLYTEQLLRCLFNETNGLILSRSNMQS